MKGQALSIYQMLKLKELGVDTSKSSMVRILTDEDGNTVSWGEITWMDNRWVILDYDNKVYELYEDIYDVDGSYDHSYTEECGVFTLQDILEILPKEIDNEEGDLLFINNHCPFDNNSWELGYFKGYKEGQTFAVICSGNLLSASYELLVWVAENGYLKGGAK